MEEFNIWKSLGYRWLRGFVGGAASTMIAVNAVGVSTFEDLTRFLSALAIAGLVGGITGSILAVDKFFRSLK